MRPGTLYTEPGQATGPAWQAPALRAWPSLGPEQTSPRATQCPPLKYAITGSKTLPLYYYAGQHLFLQTHLYKSGGIFCTNTPSKPRELGRVSMA